MDPYAGLDEFKFDPRVLALIGVEEEEKTYERRDERKDDSDSEEEEVYARPTPESPRGGSEGFFDVLSSAERGRRRCRDARHFQPSSMQRAVVDDGVVLLLGTLVDKPYTEHVICALFDRASFSEHEAWLWWKEKEEKVIY